MRALVELLAYALAAGAGFATVWALQHPKETVIILRKLDFDAKVVFGTGGGACSAREASMQAALLLEALNLDPQWAQCPSSEWLTEYAGLAGPQHQTLVDVGCGLGLTSAAWFGTWDAGRGLTPASLQQLYASLAPPPGSQQPAHEAGSGADSDSSGGVGTCAERQLALPPLPPTSSAGNLSVHCLEPSAGAYERLQLAWQHFFALPEAAAAAGGGAGGAPHQQLAAWHIVRLLPLDPQRSGGGGARVLGAAAEAAPQLLLLPRGCSGTEACTAGAVVANNSLSAAAREHLEATPVAGGGLSAWAGAAGVGPIDVLHLGDGVGGVVGAVLDGAQPLLRDGKVGLLSFGYDGGRSQAGAPLRQHIEMLHAYGMLCFLQGRDGTFAQLTGCWSDAYGHLAPARLLCAQRGHALLPSLQARSLLAVLQPPLRA